MNGATPQSRKTLPVTVMAFDVGLKRTGMAVGQTVTGTSRPAGQLTVKHGRFDPNSLRQALDKWQPDRIIIGQPNTAQNNPDNPHLLKVINRLKSFIQQNHKLPIIDWDEAYTSASANAELQTAGVSQADKTRLRDQLAACLILEAYFDSL